MNQSEDDIELFAPDKEERRGRTQSEACRDSEARAGYRVPLDGCEAPVDLGFAESRDPRLITIGVYFA